ncbi:MAG: hypothetical protein A3F92_17010 [Candidatus Rokubacteria bacterium RIFCSPLOWO2_12_FULL_71_22]|nr:MAG: hypothetical protein A3F92_17010 [Candidatus Rokubacteria bacterium RIFCSPLOWO2_12_FULL_71_22]
MGMKNVSPRIPEAADDRTIAEMLRDLFEGGFRVERRPGGVRITLPPSEPDDADDGRLAELAVVPLGV